MSLRNLLFLKPCKAPVCFLHCPPCLIFSSIFLLSIIQNSFSLHTYPPFILTTRTFSAQSLEQNLDRANAVRLLDPLRPPVRGLAPSRSLFLRTRLQFSHMHGPSSPATPFRAQLSQSRAPACDPAQGKATSPLGSSSPLVSEHKSLGMRPSGASRAGPSAQHSDQPAHTFQSDPRTTPGGKTFHVQHGVGDLLQRGQGPPFLSPARTAVGDNRVGQRLGTDGLSASSPGESGHTKFVLNMTVFCGIVKCSASKHVEKRCTKEGHRPSLAPTGPGRLRPCQGHAVQSPNF